ncbi:Dabb family protein [Mycobacteroides abscessus]|uniref:Dabb family protein n=1 Tax=Mycobacteroides abscessus TaxID=36809 RepID=UPI0005158E9C|nr:Dabb family protein [Mycobacteroides abscessus]ORA30832.1 stress responsive protein [Mycobacteroides abscessus subsp. bolletii]TPF67706.1 stress responsive protein [Mycobacteroides abscessus subsp. bolletii]BBB43868.1 stress responsive protein [Mycobacteroides abscessus subsp. bolletii BD]
MFNVTRLIHIASHANRDKLLEDLRRQTDVADICHAIVEPTLPGSRNGGDILMHLRFHTAQHWADLAPHLSHLLTTGAGGIRAVDGVDYTGVGRQVDDAGPGTTYRTLLLRLAPGTSEDAIHRFENDLESMPAYVRTITAWQLSRVEKSTGATEWTHVFEQHFTDANGITGPYLMHPIHWGYVDRWFDPECPEYIVRDRVCHSFCRSNTHVLGTPQIAIP